MSENDLLRAVLDLAAHYGWRRYHALPAARRDGRWVTPLQGDPGWPDVALARDERVLLPELKSETGRLGVEQEKWRDAIGEQWRLWTPAELRSGEIQRELRR